MLPREGDRGLTGVESGGWPHPDLLGEELCEAGVDAGQLGMSPT